LAQAFSRSFLKIETLWDAGRPVKPNLNKAFKLKNERKKENDASVCVYYQGLAALWCYPPMVLYGQIGVNYPYEIESGITAWQRPVGGPYEGPATLTLAAVPHVARLEAI
jgi:hypothetical protein